MLEYLSQPGDRALRLVVAPAGYGKTALLGAWAQQSATPIAWLSLDATDSEPRSFWAYLVAALDAAQPGIGDRALALLGPAPVPIEQALAALINVLSMAAPMVLVLDNYHAIATESIHQALAFLLDHLPNTLQIVLVSRGEPPLPLAHWRLAGRLRELSAADLRFGVSEADCLIAQSLGQPAPHDLVTALVERTEGWPAGLRLAIRPAHYPAELAGLLHGFGGGHRDMQDYFAEEVLGQLSGEMVSFLLHSAVFDRMCAPLCAALYLPPAQAAATAGFAADGAAPEHDPSGTFQAAHNLLALAERSGLFLIPLDTERHWYRYHTLFAEALRYRLAQEDPALAAALRERAAWLAGHWSEGAAPSKQPLDAGQPEEQSSLHELALSKRELDVLHLLSDGCTNQDIAEALIIGINTVKMHIKHLYNKLDAHNRTQAVARARKLGLV